MDFLGEIVREPDPPGIDRQRWIDLIAEHPGLAPPGPREAINPFTNEPMTIQPPPDTARVVVDAVEVGVMSWAMDESNLVNVYGEPGTVIPLAREIAEALDGRFLEAEEERRS